MHRPALALFGLSIVAAGGCGGAPTPAAEPPAGEPATAATTDESNLSTPNAPASTAPAATPTANASGPASHPPCPADSAMGDECPLSSGKGVCYNGHCLSPAACKKYCADSTAGLCPADVADADCAKHPDVADEYEACMGGLCGVLIN